MNARQWADYHLAMARWHRKYRLDDWRKWAHMEYQAAIRAVRVAVLP